MEEEGPRWQLNEPWECQFPRAQWWSPAERGTAGGEAQALRWAIMASAQRREGWVKGGGQRSLHTVCVWGGGARLLEVGSWAEQE